MPKFRINFTCGSVIELPLPSSFDDDMYWYLSEADEAEIKEILNETTSKNEAETLKTQFHSKCPSNKQTQ